MQLIREMQLRCNEVTFNNLRLAKMKENIPSVGKYGAMEIDNIN